MGAEKWLGVKPLETSSATTTPEGGDTKAGAIAEGCRAGVRDHFSFTWPVTVLNV